MRRARLPHALAAAPAAALAALAAAGTLAMPAGPTRAAPPPGDEERIEWPNEHSRANSDAWLAENHDRIAVLRPRVLVVSFVNGLGEKRARAKAEALIAALRESSRWQGWRDPDAPAALEYEIARVCDLGDVDSIAGANSSRYVRGEDDHELDFRVLYGERFAGYYGFEDPDRPGSFLDLAALVDRGIVHEVWLLAKHDRKGFLSETVEVKQAWDERLRKRPGKHVRAGNALGSARAPWIGRSLRVLFFNHERGVGCAMESLGHSLERTATSGAIPYFSRYFSEYAMLDLDRRLGLPFSSFYAKGEGELAYPSPDTLVYRHRGKSHTVNGWTAAGGNVHFMPNGRRDYDLDNADPVLSTIERWRWRDGPGGEDRAAPWTPAAIAPFRRVAPDCMGPWVVYWRQNMPGPGNRALDDEGRPMKSWWPFLFY